MDGGFHHKNSSFTRLVLCEEDYIMCQWIIQTEIMASGDMY